MTKLRRTLAVLSAPLMLAALPVLAAAPAPAPGPDEAAIRAMIKQGKAAEAEAAARAALDAAIAAHGERSIEAAEARLPLAFALFALGRGPDGIVQLELRLAALEKVGGRFTGPAVTALSDLTSALMAQADTYEDAGQWSEAEPLIERIIANYAVFEKQPGRDAIRWRGRLGGNIKNQGRPADAEPVLRGALALADKTLKPGDVETLDLLNNLGRAIEAQYRHPEAEGFYRRAVEAGQKALGKDDPSVLVYAQNLGASLLYQGKLEQAGPVIRDTLERRRKVLGPDHRHAIYSLTDLATWTMLGPNPSDAGPLWEEAVARAEKTFGKDHPDTAQIRNSYFVYLDRVGDDPVKALAAAAEAAEAIRARRYAIGLDPRGQRSLATFTESDAFYFKSLLRALRRKSDMPDEPPIFRVALMYEAASVMQEAMESPANMAVIQSAAQRAAASRGPGLAALAAQRQSLSEQWAAIAVERRDLMAGGGDAARLAETAQKQAGIETEIKAIDARFTKEFPGFFDLLRPQAVDAPSIQEMLKGGEEAVLMILPTPFGTHMIAISDSDMDWQVSKLDEGMIDLAVRRLRWDLGADVAVSAEEQATWQDEGSGTYPFDRAMAHGLYRQLVEPVEGVLAGKRHVYVVAGGSLSSLPFGVLITDTPTGEDGNPDDLRATKWLADKYALIQLPSLQSLAFLRQFSSGGADKADGFLGFGDPALLGKAETRGGGKGRRGGGAVRGLPVASVWKAASGASGLAKVDVEALRKLARLPGTAIELEEMRSVLGAPMSAIVTGTAATEARVKQADLSHAAIIAFATHGLLAGEIDGSSEPGLVFTPPMSASSEDDGLLTMSEIAGLKMNADWVILSACNTAAGDGSQGATGLSGLAKAFFFAGAKSLLASHWPVRDDVASRITVRTIAIARDNPDLSHAEALQRAMREIRSNKSHDSATDTWAHPNAWAPFTLIGDARGR